jgi:hypothetical protein
MERYRETGKFGGNRWLEETAELAKIRVGDWGEIRVRVSREIMASGKKEARLWRRPCDWSIGSAAART